MPGHQHCKLARMHRSYLVLYTVLFKCAGEVRLGGPWVALSKNYIVFFNKFAICRNIISLVWTLHIFFHRITKIIKRRYGKKYINPNSRMLNWTDRFNWIEDAIFCSFKLEKYEYQSKLIFLSIKINILYHFIEINIILTIFYHKTIQV